MLWFLLGTSGLFAVLGQWSESAVLLIALLPLLGMDAYLHQRTHASVQGLSSRLASSASVERDGTIQSVPATALVPGDLVILSAGDAIPADGLLVSGERMQADESALTGEAFPVAKSPLARWPRRSEAESAVDNASLGICRHKDVDWSSTHAGGLHRGRDSLWPDRPFGDSKGHTHARRCRRPSINWCVCWSSARWCCAWCLPGSDTNRDMELVDALVSALTLAIAALPEEFPVVLTFFLGVGVYRLAKRQALVRRAVVVENIGRVTCICSDKTGTITEGRLLLGHLGGGPRGRCRSTAGVGSDRLTARDGRSDGHRHPGRFRAAPDWEIGGDFPLYRGPSA